jgi:hypothetical protein
MAKKQEVQPVREVKEYRVKWSGPAHVPAGYAPTHLAQEREGVTDDGKSFIAKFDDSCKPGGVSRIMLDGACIWSGYCWYGPGAIAKHPNIASFKITEVA